MSTAITIIAACVGISAFLTLIYALARVSRANIRMDDMLYACRDQFEFYAEQHEAKGTLDGALKARTNREWVDAISDVIGDR